MNAAYTFSIESPTEAQDQEEVSSFLEEHWGDVNIASHGKLIDASKLPRVIARDAHGTLVGLATFHPEENNQCELVSIDATLQGIGLGSTLLDRVETAAKQAGCTSLWLITTNNNQQAQSFYEHKG